jgi:hypothetical protein
VDVDQKRACRNHVHGRPSRLRALCGATDAPRWALTGERNTLATAAVGETEQGGPGDESAGRRRNRLDGGGQRPSESTPQDLRLRHARVERLSGKHRHGVDDLVVIGLESLVVVRLAHAWQCKAVRGLLLLRPRGG